MTNQPIGDDTLKHLAKILIVDAYGEDVLVERTKNVIDLLIDATYEGYITLSLDDVFRVLAGGGVK